MTDTDIRDWTTLLPGITPESKMRYIKLLMEHAIGDRMSGEDRTACRRALHLLHQDVAKGVQHEERSS